VDESEVLLCSLGGGGDLGAGGGTIEGMKRLVTATCVFCRRGLNDEDKAVEGYEKHAKGICLHAWRFRDVKLGLDVTSELPEWAMRQGGP
jgi:hypothetical protein